MMFLTSAIRAEVEPVPKKMGWYQLTGRDITRWTIPAEETPTALSDSDVKLDLKAKILGIHDFDPEISKYDPRFNHENTPDEPSFYVYTDPHLKKTFMMMNVNRAEAVIFRFLTPHESGDDESFDPMDDYRVEA